MIEGVSCEAQILDDAATDEVFLDDAFCIVRRHTSIPCPFRIHDADGAAGAHAQALAPGPVAGPVGARDVELLHPPLEVLPRRISCFGIHTIRPDAHEEMTLQLADAKRGGRLLHRFVLLTHRDRSYGT